VPDRLTPLDASFLYLEEPTTVMHVGSVMVFEQPPGGFDYPRLLELVGARIGSQSRYHQRVRTLPGRVAAPVWVDDTQFDLSYHIRRSALPRPGTDEQLEEFVGRIQSRPLDREHPLWELYVVEGLAGNRFALVTKTHQAMVDGVNAVDLPHLLLDTSPDAPVVPAQDWRPRRPPTDLELLAGAAFDAVRRPSEVVGAIRSGVEDVVSAGARVGSAMGDLASTLVSAGRPARDTPLNVRVGATRRFAMVHADLADFRAARDTSSDAPETADVSVNDVMLSVIAGGLRAWLQTRGEPIHSASTIKAMVPLSLRDDPGHPGSGDRLVPCFVNLPIGEPSPRLRVEQVAFQMRKQVGGALDAESIAGLAGFAPPTLHHLGARLGSAISRRMFNLVITNVPGPQQPRYVAGARMLATYPVMPLALGQAVAIGLTSYDGGVGIGLNGDRSAMYDLDLLGDCIREALSDLLHTP
jgi:diacylglycerol O-acyltransferase / wax synthase